MKNIKKAAKNAFNDVKSAVDQANLTEATQSQRKDSNDRESRLLYILTDSSEKVFILQESTKALLNDADANQLSEVQMNIDKLTADLEKLRTIVKGTDNSEGICTLAEKIRNRSHEGTSREAAQNDCNAWLDAQKKIASEQFDPLYISITTKYETTQQLFRDTLAKIQEAKAEQERFTKTRDIAVGINNNRAAWNILLKHTYVQANREKVHTALDVLDLQFSQLAPASDDNFLNLYARLERDLHINITARKKLQERADKAQLDAENLAKEAEILANEFITLSFSADSKNLNNLEAVQEEEEFEHIQADEINTGKSSPAFKT